MLNNLINSVTQKVFLPLWAVLILFVFFDISTRLTQFETKKSSNWKIESVSTDNALILSQEQANSIIADINNFQVTPETEVETNVNKATSEAEQLAQQGSLGELFAGNIRYRLVGIFDKGERFAVIQQHDISNNEQKLIKLSVLEHLKNYQITKVLANKITLISNDNRQISLYLYKQLDKQTDKQTDKAIK